MFRARRPISTSSAPVSEGIEILQECRFISSLIRALEGLVDVCFLMLAGIVPVCSIQDGINAMFPWTYLVQLLAFGRFLDAPLLHHPVF